MKIKLTALLLFLSMFAINKGISQTNDTIIEEDQFTKMIQKALFIVLQNEKYYIDSGFTTSKINNDFFIWIDHFPAGFELTQEIIDLKLKIKFISIYNLTKKQKKEGIGGVGFSGIIIDGKSLKFYFNSKHVFLKGKELYMGIDGEGYLFEYEYSCEKKEWVLIKSPSQNGGQ